MDRPLRFLLLAYDRSGSTLLVNYLNSHPGVQCFHEPFNRRIWKDVVRHYGSIPATLSAHYDRNRVTENIRVRQIAAKRSAATRTLLFAAERLRNRLRQPDSEASTGSTGDQGDNALSAIGLKVTTTQLFKAVPELWHHICADLPDRVIVLRRSSLIERFLSCQFALKTGVWQSEVPVQRADSSIAVNFDEFCAFVDEEQRFDASIQEATGASDTQWLNMTYEDLVESRDATLDRLFGFLGLQPPGEVDGKLSKLSRGSARSRVSNFAELAELAAGTRYERHLT